MKGDAPACIKARILLGLLRIHSLSLLEETAEDQTIILNGNITTIKRETAFHALVDNSTDNFFH